MFRTINLIEGHSWMELHTLPEEIRVNPQVFEELWSLRPDCPSKVRVFGHLYDTPRLMQTFGQDYYFSGQEHPSLPVTHPYLIRLREWVHHHSGLPYGQILINWYRSGQDYIADHSDDEKSFVPGSAIYSFSFGAQRKFNIRSKKTRVIEQELSLKNNTLVIMCGEMQKYYKHGVPKSSTSGRRLNITFRYFLPSQ